MIPGTSLGPYRIDRELGSGGMGKVYAATAGDTARAVAPGVTVALKLLHPHLLETPGFFKRFLREAEIGQTVRHANVVRTLDCDSVVVDGQRHDYLAMEYVEGQTLRDLLDEMEQVPEELCRHIGREVSKGLAAIHEAGAVHRDLKPENVLITPDHQVKVMDLGVARLMDEALRLSQTGAFVGSLHYAAPEQFQGGGKDLDGRTDLHALGLVLYELATGQHPFLADSVPEIVNHVLRTEPRKVGQIHPQLSAFFEEAVQCLLAKDRTARFASATALFAALEAGEESEWWRARARALQAETQRPLRRIRIPRETAVYGREKELTLLTGLYEKAKAGDGQVVLIEGEAGIGKSRLVDELIARLQAGGEDVNFLFGGYPPGGAATANGAFSAAYREHFGQGGCAEHLTRTPTLIPAFDALLEGESAPADVQQLTKDSLQTCFVNVTRSLASERPTVILIDDLHFAPDDGRALFTALAMAALGSRVLLVGTTRPGVSEEWTAGVTRLDQTSHIALHRLGPKDLTALLGDCFKSEHLAMGLAAQIGVKSDGNPFFAFEIIRGLREGQFITQRDDGTWITTRVIDKIRIPSSVLDLVNARVADLTEEERDLLDVACCWGHEFDPGLIGEVLGLRRIPLLKRFGQIERAHRLVRASGRSYVFDHHQVQEALYGSLHEQLREEYHAALADALETRTRSAEKDPRELDGALCVDLCEHYLEGARGESALRYLPAAQEHLTAGHLHAQVVALTERALAVPDLLVGRARAQMLLRATEALGWLGRRPREEEAAREAQRLADEVGDEELRSRAAVALGAVLASTSRYEEAATTMRGELERALACGDATAESVARTQLGSALESLGRLPEAQEELERALAISRRSGDRPGELKASGNLGNVLSRLGRFTEARACHERDLELSIETGDVQGEVRSMTNLGLIAVSLGLPLEAQTYYDRALAVSRETGNRRGEAIVTGNLGALLGSAGRLVEAQEYTEQYLALCRETGDRQGVASATSSLGADLWALGRMPQAREAFERSLATDREIGYRSNEAMDRYNLAVVAREEGDHEGSEAHLLAGIALCEEFGYRPLAAFMQRALGSLLLATGDVSRAREALEAALTLSREVGDRGDETLARCELALLPGGSASDALAAFAEHETQLTADDLREARSLLWRTTGDRVHLAEAKRLLDERLSAMPAEHHDAMRSNVRVNREIMEAWRAEFGGPA